MGRSGVGLAEGKGMLRLAIGISLSRDEGRLTYCVTFAYERHFDGPV